MEYLEGFQISGLKNAKKITVSRFSEAPKKWRLKYSM